MNGSQTFIVNLNYLFHRFSILYEKKNIAQNTKKKKKCNHLCTKSESFMFTSKNDNCGSISKQKMNNHSIRCPHYMAFYLFRIIIGIFFLSISFFLSLLSIHFIKFISSGWGCFLFFLTEQNKTKQNTDKYRTTFRMRCDFGDWLRVRTIMLYNICVTDER